MNLREEYRRSFTVNLIWTATLFLTESDTLFIFYQ